jgi:hypothetical protein
MIWPSWRQSRLFWLLVWAYASVDIAYFGPKKYSVPALVFVLTGTTRPPATIREVKKVRNLHFKIIQSFSHIDITVTMHNLSCANIKNQYSGLAA